MVRTLTDKEIEELLRMDEEITAGDATKQRYLCVCNYCHKRFRSVIRKANWCASPECKKKREDERLRRKV